MFNIYNSLLKRKIRMIKIYGTKTSPYTRKVRIVASEKKLDWGFECFAQGQTQEFTLNGLNPLGKVPVLMLNENIVVFDSPVIAEYLDNLAPNKKLIPEESSREKMMVRRWEALADGICDIAISQVVMELRRPQEKQDGEIIKGGLAEIHSALIFASKELGDKEYCVGQSICLGDIALLCALDYLNLRIPDINWQEEFPNLNAHFQKMYKLPSVIETTPF